MKSWPTINGDLAEYVDRNWLRDSPLKRRLREETAKLPQAGMQISAHQGQHMALLAKAIGAGKRSRSAPSLATPRCVSPRHCHMTARSGAATSARNGPASGGAIGRRPAWTTRSN
jgi:hypothetical protein